MTFDSLSQDLIELTKEMQETIDSLVARMVRLGLMDNSEAYDLTDKEEYSV